ncbi:hypothetical protein DPMN_116275 [Dreissena polymorpha]|uniref:Uncharacterized protein n=1 Tax=Dreissena polymorpha TaxID=45954 RepID=A0A9D4KPI9_DREPO|nr:hypothetical protein DPMN_116275 [Dreissena polymorpha]
MSWYLSCGARPSTCQCRPSWYEREPGGTDATPMLILTSSLTSSGKNTTSGN